METKICKRCGKELPVSKFYSRYAVCKECIKARREEKKHQRMLLEQDITIVESRSKEVKRLTKIINGLAEEMKNAVGDPELYLKLRKEYDNYKYKLQFETQDKSPCDVEEYVIK